MNNMFGIEGGIFSNNSRANSGRGDNCGTHTQGIVLAHEALGWVLMAFQAIAFAAFQAAN